VASGYATVFGKTTYKEVKPSRSLDRTNPSAEDENVSSPNRAIVLTDPQHARRERDEPYLTSVKDATLLTESRIPVKPDEDGSSTTSLAPGWKQQASWGVRGAVVWIGGFAVAVVWAVLLC
jgi:hypothetical protein